MTDEVADKIMEVVIVSDCELLIAQANANKVSQATLLVALELVECSTVVVSLNFRVLLTYITRVQSTIIY